MKTFCDTKLLIVDDDDVHSIKRMYNPKKVPFLTDFKKEVHDAIQKASLVLYKSEDGYTFYKLKDTHGL